MPQNLKNNEIHATFMQNQGWTKSIGNTSWRSPGYFFIDFGVDFGGPGVLFESQLTWHCSFAYDLVSMPSFDLQNENKEEEREEEEEACGVIKTKNVTGKKGVEAARLSR